MYKRWATLGGGALKCGQLSVTKISCLKDYCPRPCGCWKRYPGEELACHQTIHRKAPLQECSSTQELLRESSQNGTIYPLLFGMLHLFDASSPLLCRDVDINDLISKIHHYDWMCWPNPCAHISYLAKFWTVLRFRFHVFANLSIIFHISLLLVIVIQVLAVPCVHVY